MSSGAKTSLSLQKNHPKVIKPGKFSLSSTLNPSVPKSQLINNDNLNSLIDEDENEEIRIRIRNEDIFDNIMDKILNVPIEQALEGPLKQLFNCSFCIFWIDNQNDMTLFSPSRNVTVGLSNSVVGYTRLTRSVIQIQNQQQCPPNFIIDSSIDVPENSKHIFFPISSSDIVYGVIQIIRTPDMPAFSEIDLDSVKFVMNKFSLIGNCVFNTSHLCDMSLSFFRKKSEPSLCFLKIIEKYFQCKSAELWKYDLSNSYYFYDRQTNQLDQIDSSDFGIVGLSLTKSLVINERMASTHSSFNTTFDGNIDGPILAVPYEKNKQETFCLVLRGRSRSFSIYDEREVMSIMPFIVRAASNNSSNGEDIVSMLTSLLDTSSKLVSCLNFPQLIDVILKQSTQLFECEKAVILLSDKKKEFFTRGSDFVYEGELNSDAKISIGKGVASSCFKEKKILNIVNPKSDNDFCNEVDCCVPDLDPLMLLAAPILDLQDEAVGVLLLYNKHSAAKFSETDENLAASFNVFVGIALENAKHYRVCYEFSNSLIKFFDEKSSDKEALFDAKKHLSDLMEKALDVAFCDRITLFVRESIDEFIPIINVGCESNFGSLYAEEAADKKSPLLLNSEKLNSNNNLNNDTKDRSFIRMNNRSKTKLISGFFSENQTTNYKSKNDSDENLYLYPILNDQLFVVAVIEYHFFNGRSDNEITFFNSFGSLCELSFSHINLPQMKLLGYNDLDIDELIDESERLSFKTPLKLQLEEDRSSSLSSLNFDVDKFDEMELFKVVFSWFEKFNFIENFEISSTQLFNFLKGVREMHRKVHPISWKKAVDSFQFVSFLIQEGKIENICSKEQIFAMILCSICGGAMLEKSTFSKDIDSLLNRYCGCSEIEKCFNFISVLSSGESDLLRKLNSSQSKPILETVVDLILSLDMSHHFTILNEFMSLLNSGELNLEKLPHHKFLLMKIIVKCGDLCSLARPFETAKKSFDYIGNDFYRKGEIERASGVVFESSGSKRDEINKNESLKGFLKSVALPLFQALSKQFSLLSIISQQVSDNITKYEKLLRSKK